MRRADFIAAALKAHTGECLMWPFAVRKSSGYPAHNTPRPEKRTVDGHRYICALAHGPAPEGLEAAHACGNRLCMNPNHLSWKTPKENMADAISAGVMPGGGRGRQRLFAADRHYIATSGKSLLELAREFGSAPSYMGTIRREYRIGQR